MPSRSSTPLLAVALCGLAGCLSDADLSGTGWRCPDLSCSCISPTPACPAGAIFCDAFEGSGDANNFPGWQRAVQGSPVAAEHQGGFGCNGSRAFEAYLGNGHSATIGKALSGLSTVWMRALVYLPPGQSPSQDMAIVMVDAGTPTLTSSNTIGVTKGGNLTAEAAAAAGASGEAGQVPTGRWFCLEAGVTVAEDSSGQILVYLEGQQALDVRGETTMFTPAAAQAIRFGLESSGGPFRVQLDDVAIGTSRLGCP
jgi:hypothetical protein